VKVGCYLACSVGVFRIHGLLPCHVGPGALVVDLGVVRRVEHGCRRRRNDHPSDGGCADMGRCEDVRRTLNGWVEAVLDGVIKVQLVG
jgi:hypothetical protein